jgi:DNA-binding transcriptional ArsR family regulator
VDGYQRLSEILKSLGHPARLQIIEVLGVEKVACVCHLEHVLGFRQPYISQQLARLKEAGLIEAKREGLNVFYSLSPEISPAMIERLKHMAIETSKEGENLKFERKQKRHASCPCPKCREKHSIPPTFLNAIKEKIMGMGR